MSKVVILTGPSGVGKSSIKRMLLEEFLESLVIIPSYITRAKRNDEDLNDYIFVSEDEFVSMDSRGEFLESSNHYGSWYGTPTTLYHEYLECGLNPIKDINIDGALRFKEEFGSQCVVIYVSAPTKAELEHRLLQRDGKVDLARINEFSREERFRYRFDYEIINRYLDESFRTVARIIRSELGMK